MVTQGMPLAASSTTSCERKSTQARQTPAIATACVQGSPSMSPKAAETSATERPLSDPAAILQK